MPDPAALGALERARAVLAAAEAVVEVERLAEAAAAAKAAAADAAFLASDSPLLEGPAAIAIAAVLFVAVAYLVWRCTSLAYDAARFALGVVVTLVCIRAVQITWAPWLTLNAVTHAILRVGGVLKTLSEAWTRIGGDPLETLQAVMYGAAGGD